MKKKTAVIIPILIVLALVLVGALTFWLKRVKMNPPGTVGNTAGNINNGGFFCEYDGTVYFANAYANNSLCSMDPAEGNIKSLSDISVCNLLAGGSYLYYFQTGQASGEGLGYVLPVISFNRCDLKGKNMTGLLRETVISGQLVNNYLYLMTSYKGQLEFKKVKIDKSETTVLANYEINPACARDGVIYYNGTQDDHYLYGLDTDTDVRSVVWEGNLWYPILEGDYVYYMDVAENYRLCRYSLSQDVVEVLTHDRADCFNVGGGYIYYQKNGATPQLICMRTDGTDPKVIAEGNYTHINMTSQYVYFQAFGEDSGWYHSALGSSGYSEFTAARDMAE